LGGWLVRMKTARLALLASLLVAACGPTAPQGPAGAPSSGGSATPRIQNLTISLPSQSATSASLQIAERQGFFAKYGLHVEFTLHSGGPPALQALLADAAQATIQITGTTISAFVNGADVVIVAGSQSDPDYQLYARAEITTAKGLAGKRIATADPGSEFNTILKKTLVGYGVPADGYDPVNVGSSGQRLAAVVAGAADATLLSAPQSFDAEAKGLRHLGSSAAAVPKYMFTTLAVKRDWARANKDTVISLIRGDQDALEWMDKPENRAAVIKHLTDITGASADAAAKTYDLYIAGAQRGKVFPKQAQVDRAGVEAVLAIMNEGGLLKRAVKVDDIVDFSYVELASKR